MRTFLPLFLIVLTISCNNELNSSQLLKESIAYHDPENNWTTFRGEFHITMEIPEQSNRESDLRIDLPADAFYVKAVRDTITTEFDLKGSECRITYNGSENFSEEIATANRLSCERATMYKNYYTYLYGLPMKLKDPGTDISPEIQTKEFKGKTYDVIEVKYDPEVGSDIWYFYFDPETHAMEIYQFYKTDDNGEMIPDSGEYIMLEDIATVSGIKMPKVRTWYYNKDDKLLGADILQ
ncbi:MAG: hypothetical protein HKO67_03460 [Flavobacteriaceae bacterium]|nr:hypothetical protein [Bacteroidia bacterium]NNL79528.1 hypothetical protein [Flavobacteriaceae bacterium]